MQAVVLQQLHGGEGLLRKSKVQNAHACKASQCDFPARVVHFWVPEVVFELSVVTTDGQDFSIEENEQPNLTQGRENHQTEKAVKFSLFWKFHILSQGFKDILFAETQRPEELKDVFTG
jgi:hypothetical protein